MFSTVYLNFQLTSIHGKASYGIIRMFVFKHIMLFLMVTRIPLVTRFNFIFYFILYLEQSPQFEKAGGRINIVMLPSISIHVNLKIYASLLQLFHSYR